MAAPTASELAAEQCQPCRADSPRVEAEEAQAFAASLPNWRVVDVDGMPQLHAAFRFADFAAALAFVDQVGALAEAADHHPRIVLEWGRVEVAWWTHAIGGLHRNDFVMAARCDAAAGNAP